MTDNLIPVSAALDPEIRDLLEKMAADEKRSLSQVIRLLLDEALEARKRGV